MRKLRRKAVPDRMPGKRLFPAGYDVATCIAHLDSLEGADCRDHGCRARRACPVGAQHRYAPDQAQFHLQAFRKAQR